MKRLIVRGLSVLLLAAVTAPAVRAQRVVINSATLNNTFNPQLTPFNLVTLAHQGYFQQQSIPSYNRLSVAYQLGKITAKDLVTGAVKARQLDPKYLTDRSYLKAVEAQLSLLENIH